MKFLSLTASNIFSLGEDVKLKLDNQGLLLIRGWSYDENNENGAGKSSLVNKALTWAIYGKTIGGVTGDKVINRHTNIKKASADLLFEGDDGTVYSISRSRNPTNLTLSKLRGIEGSSWFWDDISRKTARATQEAIELLIGRSFDTFRQAEFFGQGRKESFFELTPSAQTETVQSILPMEQLDEWAKIAKESYNNLGAELDAAIINYSNKKTALNEIKNHIKENDKRSAEWDSKQILHISDKECYIKSLEEKNGTVPEEINTLNLKLNKEFDLDYLTQDFKLKEQLNLLKKFSLKLGRNIVLNQQIIRDLEHIQNQHEKELNNIKLDEKGFCHSCLQPISNERIIELKNLATDYIKKIKELKEKSAAATIDLEKSSEELKSTNLKCDELNSSIKEIENKKEKYFKLKDNLNILKDLDLSKDIKTEKKLLEQKLEERNPYVGISLEIIQREIDLNIEITALDYEIAFIKKELEHVNFWVQGYGRHIKTFILNQTCPFLQERTNIYLSELGNPQIEVKFSTVKDLASGESKDQFNITVESKTGGAAFDLLSGGEQQIASFAVGLALADLANTQASGSSNIIILDEPFENLSPKNSAAVIDFLTTKMLKETVLLISNEAAILELIPNSIKIVKKGGVSWLEDTL